MERVVTATMVALLLFGVGVTAQNLTISFCKEAEVTQHGFAQWLGNLVSPAAAIGLSLMTGSMLIRSLPLECVTAFAEAHDAAAEIGDDNEIERSIR